MCFTPTPPHWHHSASWRRRTIENTWHHAVRGNRKAVFVHTQLELSCDGWTDEEILFDLNKTKRGSRKTQAMSTCRVPWASLTFTVGISDVHLSETGNSYTTKRKWLLYKLHSTLHVCLCLCDQGWKTSSGPGEDASSCIPQSGAPKLVFIGKQPERFSLKVCVGLACLNGKKISACLCT